MELVRGCQISRKKSNEKKEGRKDRRKAGRKEGRKEGIRGVVVPGKIIKTSLSRVFKVHQNLQPKQRN